MTTMLTNNTASSIESPHSLVLLDLALHLYFKSENMQLTRIFCGGI